MTPAVGKFIVFTARTDSGREDDEARAEVVRPVMG